MKFKKSMIILILAVFLISIAGVCASDVNDTAVTSQEDAVTELIDENLKMVEDTEPALSTADEEILSDSADDESVGAENDLDELSATQSTYSGLSSEIGSGGNIKLSYDYYTYDNGDTIEITTDDSVIDGNGAIIDMIGSNIQALKVTASNVTIKNLNIINANAQQSGAAIFFNKTGFVENCNFTNNTASGSFNGGGAICFNNTANVINCNFVNNTASGLVNGGGAIFYINGAGNVINCNFTNNAASGTLNRGGAINWVGDNCNVSGCRFVNNFAESGSGAISWGGINGNLSDCVFVNNSGTVYDGGAVFFSENGYVTDCVFVNNSIARNGGAVYFYDKGTVTNCNFTNNSADNHGGAIFFFANGVLTNCNLTNNSAEKNGGAVCFYEDGDVTNCIFADNKAVDSGGAVIFYEDGGFVSDCNFTNCSSSEYGGAVYFDGNGAVSNCNFAICSAGQFGGAVCFFVNGDVSNCNFTNNQAPTAGGVFIYGNGDVTNSNFIDNSAGTAGAVYLRGSGEISNCNFTDNSAETAGAVYLRGSGEISNCNFTDNSAETAGAVYIRAGGKLGTSNVTNNTATNGGAVYINENGVVENCSFNDNTAMNYGGAVYINENGVVTNCNFVKNSAEYAGVLFINGTVGVTNCNFSDNKATDGGAIYWNGTDGAVSGCSFVNNNAGNYGGAIYWNGTDGKVSDCIFVNNSADEWGGAIYWRSVNGSVSDCSFVNNSAYYGGAIKWQRSNGSVSGCSFVNNSADSGGAIWWTTFNGVVSGCVFENNSGGDGVIYFSNGKFFGIDLGQNLTINDNIFLNNEGHAINFYRNDSTSNADFNWFGNNATNYDIAPGTNNTGITTWLFLNATANPDWVNIPDSSEIIFKLYAYSPEEISEYDNGRLSDVNLTLTPTNGRVNTARAKLGESVEYTPESIGFGNLTATIENATYTVTLTITDGTTFSDLNRLINGNNNSTITLDRDYAYNPEIDYNLNDGIVINRAVTIIGNNHTINAAGQARIFKVQASGVTIENLTFENAKANGGSGGAIHWSGANGKISDCVFANNSADEWGGAIIWFSANNGVVSGCVFVNNSCGDNTGGSVIEWHDNDYGVVSDCVFINNRASDVSGVVYWMGNRGNVSGCYFANNSARFGIVYLLDGSDFMVNNNIFLNNDADAIYSLNKISTSNADYNWFGQNATNYNIKPSFHKMQINSWLFLNATADPASILITESSDILFKLYSYDSTEISDYDNRRLKEVCLTLTPTNGRVNTTQTGLGEAVKYNPEFSGIGKLTAAIENVSYTISVTVSKADVTIDVVAEDVTYGEDVIVSVTGNVTGDYTVTVNGVTKDVALVAGEATSVNFGILDADTYVITANYAETDNYNAANETAEFTVVKANSTLDDIDDIIFDYGSIGSTTVSFTGASGVVAEVLSQPDAIVNVDGDVITVSNLKVGTYTLSVTTITDDNHNNITKTATITVNKGETIVSLVYDSDAKELIGTLTNAEGKGLITAHLYVTVDGVEYALLTNSRGQVKVSTENLTIGSHNASILYKGNGKFSPANDSVVIKVKGDTIVSLVYDAVAHELIGTLTNAEGKGLITVHLYVTVDGVEYALLTNSRGQVKVSTENLTIGSYNASIVYKGNGRYSPSNASAVIKVKGDTNISLVYDADAHELVGTLTNAEGKVLNSANVNITLDGVEYALKTNSRGQVKVSTENLTYGKYSASMSYNGNNKYNPSTAKIIVNTKLNPSVTLVHDADNHELVATLTNAEGKALTSANVIISVDGVDYALKTNSRGQAKLSTADFALGNYTAFVSYKGNAKYNSTSATEEIVIE